MIIVELEIHPIKDDGDTASIAPCDADADYFSLFGRVDGEENDFYVCIGDYPSRHEATLTKDLLDNKSRAYHNSQQ